MSDGDHPRRWAWSDAWLLAADMMVGKAGGSLSDVVAAADAVNDAILTESEVEPDVRKLPGANLIGAWQRRFFLTCAGRVMKAVKRGGRFDQVDHLLRALRRLPVNERERRLQPGKTTPGRRRLESMRRTTAGPA